MVRDIHIHMKRKSKTTESDSLEKRKQDSRGWHWGTDRMAFLVVSSENHLILETMCILFFIKIENQIPKELGLWH